MLQLFLHELSFRVLQTHVKTDREGDGRPVIRALHNPYNSCASPVYRYVSATPGVWNLLHTSIPTLILSNPRALRRRPCAKAPLRLYRQGMRKYRAIRRNGGVSTVHVNRCHLAWSHLPHMDKQVHLCTRFECNALNTWCRNWGHVHVHVW